MPKITAGYNVWRILWWNVAQYRRSMRGVLVILSFGLGNCAGSIPDKDVRSFSDAELLVTYGALVHDNSQVKRSIYPFEQEVQNRRLLNDVREVDDIQNNVVHVGMRSAVVLATFGEPFVVIRNQNDRGLQVWRYLNALPSLFPVNVQAKNGDRIFWTIANLFKQRVWRIASFYT